MSKTATGGKLERMDGALNSISDWIPQKDPQKTQGKDQEALEGLFEL